MTRDEGRIAETPMPTTRFQDLQVYQVAEQLADVVWGVVLGWNAIARDTVGKQVIRSADSIGANIAEGTGRKSFQDNRRFIRIARGSLYETQHWLRRAYRRQLLSADEVKRVQPLVERLGPLLNGYLRSIGRAGTRTKADERVSQADGPES